jgi:hypothetical protein
MRHLLRSYAGYTDSSRGNGVVSCANGLISVFAVRLLADGVSRIQRPIDVARGKTTWEGEGKQGGEKMMHSWSHGETIIALMGS